MLPSLNLKGLKGSYRQGQDAKTGRSWRGAKKSKFVSGSGTSRHVLAMQRKLRHHTRAEDSKRATMAKPALNGSLSSSHHGNGASTDRSQKSKPRSSRPPHTPQASSSSTAGAEPKLPMTPAVAIKKYSKLLTPFEISEVLKLSNIYFVGNTTKKVKGIPHAAQNCGYDDERGDYKVVPHDHLGYRYEILGRLGKGSFGQVLKVRDHKDGKLKAVKLIRNKKRFHHQALVEVKVLEHIMEKDKSGHSNIVRMHRFFYFRNHLCITFELLSMNLYEFIKHNGFRGFKLALIRRFACQLLMSLRFLHRERIIHCDLKPENILLCSPSKTSIRLVDFGSSCFDKEVVYTYIQSRFYRAPEVILGLSYNLAIDMWSLGCILAELYTGYPLFPGEDEKEQIQCMMEVLGVPPTAMLRKASRTRKFFDADLHPKLVPNSRGRTRKPASKALESVLHHPDQAFVDFVLACLEWDPKKRLTPSAAMAHPWINSVSLVPQSSKTPRYGKSNRSNGRSHAASKDSLSSLRFPPIASSSKPKPNTSRRHASHRKRAGRRHFKVAQPALPNGLSGSIRHVPHPPQSKGLVELPRVAVNARA